MSTVRIAVVGAGARARDTWLPLLSKIEGYRIAGLTDAAPGRAAAAAREAGVTDATIYPTYADVLADDQVDAVALVVRDERQGALAAQALRAGKHVSAEVPCAHTIADCWDLVAAARESSAVYQLAEQTRYWGFVEEWTRLVREGSLGHVTLAEGQYLHHLSSGWFDEDGQPTWLHRMPPLHYLPHELSPLLRILDDRVVEVMGVSTGPNRAHPELSTPEAQVALMRTSKGAILRLTVSFAQPHPDGDWHWYAVTGTAGRVEWRRSRSDSPKAWFVDGSREPDLQPADWGYQRVDAPIQARGSGHGDADYYVHANFLAAVRGEAHSQLDAVHAVQTAAPAILAAESAAGGGTWITVPDFTPPTDAGSHTTTPSRYQDST